MKIISGENIQLRCDYLIGTKRDLDFNPKLKQIANYKKINIDEMRSPLQINHFSERLWYLAKNPYSFEYLKLIGELVGDALGAPL